MSKTLRFSVIVFTIAQLLFFYGCKKSIDAPVEPVGPTKPESKTDIKLLNDSIYYYYKLYSLWEESIPAYSATSKFTDALSSPYDVLNALKKRTPYYSEYGSSFDRFSNFTELSGFSSLNADLKMDSEDGYGIFFAIGVIDNQTAYPFLSMVEGGSPGAVVGLKRSDMVLTLNGMEMKIDVDCSSGTCKVKDENKFKAIDTFLKSSLLNRTMNIKVERANNITKTYDLAYKTYEIDPLLRDTILEFSNKNVGYFAYSSFEQIQNNNHNQRQIDQLFRKFDAKNIKALIVDLRYNGGGYVDAATYIADKIINAKGKDKPMLKYVLNPYLSKGKNTINSSFKDVNYKKTSNLELETVCFIVSNRTASASEMLINVLKPYMNVKIVAEQSNTYGKPVGFFPQDIMNKVELWVTSFKLLNANNESDYWTGFKGDTKGVDDYIFLDFANKEEKMIAAALTYTGAVDNKALKATKSISASNKLMSKMSEVNSVSHKGAIKIVF